MIWADNYLLKNLFYELNNKLDIKFYYKDEKFSNYQIFTKLKYYK